MIDLGQADFKTYFEVGGSYFSQNNYEAAIPFFLKSIELKKNNGDAHYNLGESYLYIDSIESALKYSKNAIELYDNKSYKSDAAKMVGIIYDKTNDKENALKYYELANKLDPNNFNNLKVLLDNYLKYNNSKSNEILSQIYNLDPTEPNIFNELVNIYKEYNKNEILISFFKTKLSEKNKNIVDGNLYLYLGRIYFDIDKKISKIYLIKAKETFSLLFEKDHMVFELIDDLVKKIDK